MHLEYPLVLGIILLFMACAYWCQQRQESLIFPHMGIFSSQKMIASWFLRALKWLGIVMVIIALASPYEEREIQLDPHEGYDIILMLDASQSMAAQGFDEQNPRANRFEVVQQIVGDFVLNRPADNLGMIVFGEYAFVASPITYDKHILAKLLQQLYIGVAGKKTAIFDAIAQAVTLIHENEAKSKIAILLTDGRNTTGSMPYNAAISLAQREGLKIYTIGIGHRGEFSEGTLAKIAEDTGGKFFAAYSASQLAKVYDEINALEKSELEGETYEQRDYYYIYFLFVGLLSLMLYLVLRSKRMG